MTSEASARYCDFCGLPLPKRLVLGSEQPAEEIDYCCSGCRTVASVESANAEHGSHATSLLRLGLAIFFAMNVMVFTMALWSQDLYPEQDFNTPLSKSLRGVFRWASLLFSLPVFWLLGGPIASGVQQAIVRRAITADLLILLGVIAAYAYSIVSVIRGEGHVYFEVAVMVLIFVTLGRWLEAKGKRQTNQSLDALTSLLPPMVRLQIPDGTFQEVAREQVATGDLLRVLPGERIAVDGRILQGEASIDQHLVTGESQSQEKGLGDNVYSGTLNLDGDLLLRVTAADGRETVSRLMKMIRTARETKTPREQLVDRIATWFVPLVCLIALVAAYSQGQRGGFDQGILAGLAVTLIACPCALGLATPMAIWNALGRSAEAGVLFRSGQVLQQLATIRAICFDKTGTLTEGKPSVEKVLLADRQSHSQLLEIAAAIAAGSNHSLSQSIVSFARENIKQHNIPTLPTVETLPGRGLRCELPEYGVVLLGSHRLMKEAGLAFPQSLVDHSTQHQSTQQVFIGWNRQVRGIFFLKETLRPETAAALDACREMGLTMYLLSGDQAERAKLIGHAFSLPIHSNQLPEDKVEQIKNLAEQGDVAMVGDGLNDAPALAVASVGVALGCGTDLSRDAAGVCLLNDDLRKLPWAIGLAKQTDRVVKQNLAWAFAYNSIGIALAAVGRLNPVWAALAMALSSLLVVTNSLRLKQYPNDLGESKDYAGNDSSLLTPKSNASLAATLS